MPKVSWMTTIAGFRPLGSHTQNTSLSSVVTLTPLMEDAVTIKVIGEHNNAVIDYQWGQ